MNDIEKTARALPIYEKRAEIISAIQNNQVVVVAGETGSGKTTQLPFFCMDAGCGKRGKIAITQPRRIAATSIAARVATQMKCEIGETVGYKIRFAEKTSPQTVIKFMTDGILLAEIERDRELKKYDTIIIDEAHERNLNIDFLLGYLRKLLPKRPDLKIIISSATIDVSRFSQSFDNAPIIEASGRLYPIETFYRAPQIDNEEDECADYVEEAVGAAFDILDNYGSGDMLIFMPTERDIRETCDKLNGLKRDAQVLPLFSRLTRGEQNAIFSPSDKQRIIVCTNIAETSITVPNIRYVVDTGLARMLRYAPRLRTNRLPVERISRASANQRKGRCGRVRDGVCVRLYSEDDFNTRDEFTEPEIKRSNLAGVILTMSAHNLGNIEDFPFIEPPSKQAIFEGYAQLKELGALDKSKRLTPLGRQMSKLPFDPHISRMIIAAQKENALREVKIIAAALSIVDPRERPFDKQAEADAMHKKFTHKDSDFLTYINIWDAFQNEWKTLKTQGKMRKFCKEHFLSYTRMQEWHDVHEQLDDVLKTNAECGMLKAELKKSKHKQQDADINVDVHSALNPDAIHRSLLTGLLANCAYLDQKTGKYKMSSGKEVLIFPGSTLAKTKCEWFMCHEIIETSRVFARTVAKIEPKWLEELAANFCKRTFETPFFDAQTGYVRATERVTFFGMPLAVRKNALYSKAEPALAAKIFIYDGLVAENLVCHHPFYKHNKNIKKKVLLFEEKLRSRSYYSGDDAMFDFYAQKLPNVASISDLNNAIKKAGNDKFLFMQEEDILNAAIPQNANDFPDYVNIGNQNFALRYAFSPGAEDDGVTLALPQKALPFVDKETLGWLLPALWSERIKSLLSQLPRKERKIFMPINEAAHRLAKELKHDDGVSFAVALSRAIKNIYNIDIDSTFLEPEKTDAHLELKIEVRDDKNNVVVKGRSGEVFKQINNAQTGAHLDNADTTPWDKIFASYAKIGITDWPSSENLEKNLEISNKSGGLPIRGFAALVPTDDNNEDDFRVNLVYFASKTKSDTAHIRGVKRLLKSALVKELAWTERDLSFSREINLICAPFANGDTFKKCLYNMICNSIIDFDDAPRCKEAFEKLVTSAKEATRGIGFKVLTTFEKSLRIFADNSSRLSSLEKKMLPQLAQDLRNQLDNFLNEILKEKITLEIFLQYPRYLNTFAAILEKAAFDPQKYRQKQAAVQKYVSIYETLRKEKVSEALAHTHKRHLNNFAHAIREYEVSIFAQHIKTLYPVSEKRLDKTAATLRCIN